MSGWSSRDVDAGVERMQERQLARYEAEIAARDAEAEAVERCGEAGHAWEHFAGGVEVCSLCGATELRER